MTCDWTYLLGNTNLIQIIATLSLIWAINSLNIFQYHDTTGQLSILHYTHLIQTRKIRYNLKYSSRSKIIKNINFFSKLMWDILFPLALIFVFLILLGFTIVSHIDQASDYSYIMTFIVFIITYISIEQLLAIYFYLIVIVFITLSLLTKKFKEIKNNIKIFVEQNNRSILPFELMDLIREHNYFTKITADVNKTFRLIIFSLFFNVIPIILMLIYGTHHKDANIFGKFLSLYIGFIACLPLLILISLMIKLKNEAHSPHAIIFSYLSRLSTRLSLRNKLKIMTFSERLSGPTIGFYCYDLFPIDSDAIYKTILISLSYYILLVSLI